MPPPTFNGPTPIQLPKKTALTVAGVPDSPSGVKEAVATVLTDVKKMKSASRVKMYSAASGLVLALLGGGKAVATAGESQETKNKGFEKDIAANTKAIEKLDAGQADTAKAVVKLQVKVKAMQAEQRIVNQIVLEKLGVPRGKQPKPEPEPEE